MRSIAVVVREFLDRWGFLLTDWEKSPHIYMNSYSLTNVDDHLHWNHFWFESGIELTEAEVQQVNKWVEEVAILMTPKVVKRLYSLHDGVNAEDFEEQMELCLKDEEIALKFKENMDKFDLLIKTKRNENGSTERIA